MSDVIIAALLGALAGSLATAVLCYRAWRVEAEGYVTIIQWMAREAPEVRATAGKPGLLGVTQIPANFLEVRQ